MLALLFTVVVIFYIYFDFLKSLRKLSVTFVFVELIMNHFMGYTGQSSASAKEPPPFSRPPGQASGFSLYSFPQPYDDDRLFQQ